MAYLSPQRLEEPFGPLLLGEREQIRSEIVRRAAAAMENAVIGVAVPAPIGIASPAP